MSSFFKSHNKGVCCLCSAAATKRTIAEQQAHALPKVASGEVFSLDQQVANEDAEFRASYVPGLDHSKSLELVAINLNEYVATAAEHKQQTPLLCDLKKLLKGSRSHKFIDVKGVNSAITDKSKKCWVFKKPTGGHHG